MDWEKGRESDNVISDSGSREYRGGYPFPMRRMRLGWKGILVLLVISFVLKISPFELLNMVDSGGSGLSQFQQQNTQPVQLNDSQVKFVKVILGSTEDVWGDYFQKLGQSYEQPKLELFNGRTHSGCGLADQAMGPFYCPSDEQVYLDLDFFREMESEFQASGDFARAYVIAHEVGHHVQNLLGSMDRVDQARQRGMSVDGANGLSVRLELQADCYAGIWAHRSQSQLQWLQEGDIEEALNAAHQIGDDTLEKRSQGYAVPDSFTHGTSAQRMRWFREGFESGDIRSCDTFNRKI